MLCIHFSFHAQPLYWVGMELERRGREMGTFSRHGNVKCGDKHLFRFFHFSMRD